MRFLSYLLVVACSKDTTTDNVDSNGTGLDASVNWHEHVEPLIQKNCAACHNRDGVAGTDLTDPAVAVMYADAMTVFIQHDEMPPPASDPSCQDYKGSENMVITETEKTVFYDWADAGAPLGDPQSAPDAIDWSQSLGETNATLRVPSAYTVQPNASGNDYHCFILENPFEEDTYITGFDVELDNSKVVHHMLLTIDTEGNAGDGSGDTDLTDGWDCGDRIIETDWSLLHAWTPGMAPLEFESGDGMKVEPGDQLVLQMHYFHSESEPATDQSAYIIKTTSSVDRQVMMYPFGPTEFKIPAGDDSYSDSAELTNTYANLRILGVFPHMHWLGTGFDSTILDSEGDTVECLARGDNYNFDFQSTYLFKNPVDWALGDTLQTTCTWDNSESNPYQFNEPPKDVGFGEGTNEEMCFFLFYFTL